ncbi:class 3 adenylate cyclase [Deinococcus sp. HSC-46F16]|uniref:adenylate/guanylate cyclase domain-containing protein n=1 Tax=Deinococcus sp. HSC-46F16 TaxID=2910968 RepID=UPI00209F8653|nr:class 3 adenylate cyclase [Deinococcus sp. HSC-46F16]
MDQTGQVTGQSVERLHVCRTRNDSPCYHQGVALINFLQQVDVDVEIVLAEDYEIEITRTRHVPNFDDPFITYDNLNENKKKCKLLESCVLYVDIRNSASISVSNQSERLAKMYSAFVKNMIAAARYYGGHVRNIIGDRVMIVFDRENCFINAYRTATLMNSIAQHIIDKKIEGIDFKCGIGIDYGQMLIVKGGAIRRGGETEFYRTLVWLGRPANVASRLTDLGNKTVTRKKDMVYQGFHYPLTDKWHWDDSLTPRQFLDKLKPTYSKTLLHSEEYFSSFFVAPQTSQITHKPILVTQEVYDGLLAEHANDPIVKAGYFKETSIKIKEYSGRIYGADVIFTAVNSL